jgi:outer membrane translocation and assembly module TamA
MGSYRDRFLVAAQAEYRHRFTNRIGAVVFGGVGSVAPDFAGWEKTLWSAGAGFRFVLAPKNDISLRVDVARGRDETVYYVGVGEAF